MIEITLSHSAKFSTLYGTWYKDLFKGLQRKILDDIIGIFDYHLEYHYDVIFIDISKFDFI